MDPHSIFSISAAGMDVERMRVELAARNLANAHATTATGSPGYVPMRLVVRSAAASPAFGHVMHAMDAAGLRRAVPMGSIEPSGMPPRQVHDPAHPLADSRGFVQQPGVDPAAEMFTLMTAARAYEANVSAMTTARAMALKALEIGGNS